MNKRNLLLVFTALASLIALTFQNCGQKDVIEAALNSSTQGSLSCKITAQSFATLNSAQLASAFVSSKVQLALPSSDSGRVEALSKVRSERLPANHEVDLVFKPHCVQHSPEHSREHISELVPLNRRVLNVDADFIQTATITLSESLEVQELSEKAEADPCVIGVSNSGMANAFAQTATPNDTSFARQTYLGVIKAPQAWPFFGDNIKQDVILAVIDTGIQQSHPDLSGHLWVNMKETAGDNIDNDNNGCVDDINGCNFSGANPTGNINDDNSHGTHVSGLSTGQANNGTGIAGVMGFSLKLMGVKVLGSGGTGSYEGISNGIRYAADNGAQVINMSLGGAGENAAVADAVRYAINKGVAIVVAAGNDNTNNDTRFITPASYAATIPQMVVVASVDTATSNRSSFSNFGTGTVHIAAPGATLSSSGPSTAVVTGLYSSLPGSTWGDTYMGNPYGGTSMASPIVAGAAALARGYLHSKGAMAATAATPALIKSFLLNSATKLPALTSTIQEGRLLNVLALSQQLATVGSSTPEAAPGSRICP